MQLVKAAAATMLIVGLTAGCGGDDPSPTEPKGKAGPTPDNQTRTQDGPVTWGNWQVRGDLDPKRAKSGQFKLSTRVENVGSNPDQAFSVVTIRKGNDTVAKLDCRSKTIQPNEAGSLECFSSDRFVKGWDNITVEVGS